MMGILPVGPFTSTAGDNRPSATRLASGIPIARMVPRSGGGGAGRPDLEEERVAEPGQDGLLKRSVAAAGNPADGQGDGADDLASAVHGELVGEDGAAT